MSAILILALLPHARGTLVSGVAGGRVYFVDRTTALLHSATLNGQGVSAEPGVHYDDATEFLQFPVAYKQIPLPPALPTPVAEPAPKPPVVAPAAPEPAAGAPVRPPLPPPARTPPPRPPTIPVAPAAEEPPPQPTAPDPAIEAAAAARAALLQKLPPIEAGHNALDTKGWLALCVEAGVELSLEEKQTKPKQALVALIRLKAGEPTP